jgi:hypothetical protein
MPLATSVTARDGNNAAAPFGSLPDLAGNNAATVSLDNGRQTYRVSTIFTPFATAPLTYISIVGSATKTVRVSRIGLWMVATANASVGLCLLRGTALGTGGTAVTPTVQKLDTGSAAATAVVKHYTTAAQSLATGAATTSCITTMNLTGNLVAETVQIYAPTAYSIMYPEGGVGGQNIVLRGASDIVEVAMILGQSGGANGPPAMQMGYFVEWSEDAS